MRRPVTLYAAESAFDAPLEPAWTRLAVAIATMAAKARPRDAQPAELWQAFDIPNRNDRIVGRRDQPGVHIETAERIAQQRVASQVVMQRGEAGVPSHEVVGHLREARHLQ